jgi:ATP-dependent DNA helicase RecG
MVRNPPELLASLLDHKEAEWLEFKRNNADPTEIGANISAVSNAARLHDKDEAYIVWGIDDASRQVVGTSFSPTETKIGRQELENWLAAQLEPRIDFRIAEFEHDGKPVVVFAIQPCPGRPVAFRGVEYIRGGSFTKQLRDHPDKERALWIKGTQGAFEKEIALPTSGRRNSSIC